MLARSFLICSLVLFFSMVVEIDAFGARPMSLPPEKFLEAGAWVLLGEVVEVQVLGQEGNSEYGNVGIRVDEVLEGRINQVLVNFAYRRQLGPGMVNPIGWDMADRPEVGKKYVIFFGESVDGYGQKRNDGTYSLSLLGANPVQEVSSFDDPKIKAVREAVRLHRLAK